MNFRSVSDMSALIDAKLDVFLEHKYDLIVGIPRSGLLAGSILALKLNLPIMTLNEFLSNSKVKTGITRISKNKINNAHDARKVLLVDDSYNTGRSFIAVDDAIKNVDIKGVEYDKAVIYSSDKTPNNIDYYLEFLPQPRVFEWNIFHSSVVGKILFDIDGVVCVDPLNKENDDGVKYIQFLLNAAPKHIPTYKVKGFVTSRLEKYRGETELWMKKNNIEYGSLIMSKHKSAKDRRIAQDHAKNKADAYKKSDAILFVESEVKQAIEIARLSGKYVYCVESNMVYTPNYLEIFRSKQSIKYHLFKKLKSIKLFVYIYSKIKSYR